MADQGSSYHSGKRLPEGGNYNLNDNVSDYLKSLYDTDNDGNIDDVYTSSYFDYIGNTVTVKINVSLQPGAYTFYYGGISGTIESVTADSKSDQEFLIGSFINLHSASGSYNQSKDKFDVAPITTIFTEAYEGTITFSNSKGWLPDLCSIKVVNSNLPTQEGVITGVDISRVKNATWHDDITKFNLLDTCPEYLKPIFGNNFEKAGNQALTYPQTDDNAPDFTYLDVKRAGKYRIVVLGGDTTDAKFTFKNTMSADDNQIITTSSPAKVATYLKIGNESKDVYCFTPDTTIDLKESVYKIEIEKNTNGNNYYTIFIAMALIPADITWGEERGTDSGYYMDDSGTKYGVIRFFQSVQSNSVSNYGFYVIDSNGNVVDKAIADSKTEAETLTGIYSDLYGLNDESGNPQQTSYTMKAFVVLKGDKNPTFAPESITGTVNWNVHVTDTFQSQ